MSTFRQLAAPGVAAEVVRETRVPVLMIPADLKPGPFGYRFESMLVPVDGTAEGLAIAPHVVEGVKCFNSEVTLVNVAGEEVEPDRIVDALAALKRAKLCFERRDVPVTCSLRRGDDTADALVSFAKENRFDLLAMTTHGRGGLDRLVWGSVMESVMRQLALPMLVLRRDDDLANTVPLRSLVAAS